MNQSPIMKHLLFVHAWENLGAPYIWRGKGAFLWTPTDLKAHNFGQPVFDCSGFVAHCLWQAGGPDVRASHNAQRMFNEWVVAPNDGGQQGGCAFFGSAPDKIDHVALCLGGGQGLEACGGDHTTTDLMEAARRGARVKGGYFHRADIRGYRFLPLTT